MNHPAEGRTAGKHPKRKEGRPKATNHQSHALTERKRTTRTKTGNLFFPHSCEHPADATRTNTSPFSAANDDRQNIGCAHRCTAGAIFSTTSTLTDFYLGKRGSSSSFVPDLHHCPHPRILPIVIFYAQKAAIEHFLGYLLPVCRLNGFHKSTLGQPGRTPKRRDTPGTALRPAPAQCRQLAGSCSRRRPLSRASCQQRPWDPTCTGPPPDSQSPHS